VPDCRRTTATSAPPQTSCGWSPKARSRFRCDPDVIGGCHRRTREDAASLTGGAPPCGPADTKRAEAAARQQIYALRKPLADKLARIEKELEAIGVERQAIEAWLAKPDAYGEEGKHALRDTIARQGDLTWQLARLEAEWLEVSEALQKIGS
jgi:ATP-binding cassette subfamily F protein 3